MSYIERGEGRSIRAQQAEDDGRVVASVLAKLIGRGVTAADVVEAAGVSEWHHTGKFARRTPYYDPADFALKGDEDGDEDAEEATAKVLAAQDRRLAATVATESTYRIRWTEWSGTGRRKSREDHEYIGPATVEGNWVRFDGKRKRTDGNWITISEVAEEVIR